MPDLSIDPYYLRNLIVKVRALMSREAKVMPDEASNFTDDALPAESLRTGPDDLNREEVVQEIRGLSPAEQAELVALMWLGRGDGGGEEWRDLVQRAQDRREAPTESYLLDHPLVAEYWLEGLTQLGYGGLINGVEVE